MEEHENVCYDINIVLLWVTELYVLQSRCPIIKNQNQSLIPCI